MKKGFTLIELLVVVLIIGILSSIALPQYTKAVEKARMSEALTMIGSLKTGIDAYVIANGYEKGTFVGKKSSLGYPHVSLDVDAEASLDCSAGKKVCAGKHFAYGASCNGSSCQISAGRGTVQEYINEEYKYILVLDKINDGWRYDCVIMSDDIGEFICRNLEKQGWNAYY